jgi:hypothetical protein
LFTLPLYDGILLEQSLLLNRSRAKKRHAENDHQRTVVFRNLMLQFNDLAFDLAKVAANPFQVAHLACASHACIFLGIKVLFPSYYQIVLHQPVDAGSLSGFTYKRQTTRSKTGATLPK